MAKSALLSLVVVLVLGVVVATQELVLDEEQCAFSLNESDSTFSSPNYPEQYNASIICTWNIAVENGSVIYLTILDFYVDGTGDLLQVSDGSKLIGNFSKSGEEAILTQTFMVISSTNVLNVKLISSSSSPGLNKRRFAAKYNIAACHYEFDVSNLSSSFGPIYYLETQPSLTCTWTITAPFGRKLSLAFDEVALGKDSSVVIQEDGSTWAQYSGSGDFPDIISNGTELTVEYNIHNTSEIGVLLASFVTISDCGPSVGNLVDSTETVTVFVEGFDQNMDCRWLIQAPEGKTLMADFNTLVIQNHNDYVTFRDGPQRKSNMLGTYTGIFDSTTIKDLPLTLTSQTYLWIKLITDQVPSSGGVNFTVYVQEFGRQYLQAGPKVPFELSATTSTVTQYYRFSTEPQYQTISTNYDQVELEFTECHLSEKATMSFYDGESSLAPLLTQYSGSLYACDPVYSSGQNVFLVVDGIQANDIFSGRFSVIEPGCHGYYLDSAGTFTLSEARLNDSNYCSWNLKPSDASGVLTLVISQIMMAETDTITVHYGPGPGSPVIAQIDNSVHKSPVIFSSGHSTGPMFVEFSRPYKATGGANIVFSASYKVQGGCQKTMTATKNGQMFSPEFPNQYPINAQCFHKLNIPPGKLVHLYFNTFSIYAKHKVQIVDNTNSTKPAVIGSYTGDLLPNDIIFTGTAVEVNLSTVAPNVTDLMVAQGYDMSYTLLECGGNLTSSSGSFSTPQWPEDVVNSTTCIWIISIPSPDPKSKNITIVNMTFPTDKVMQSSNNYIEVRDGPSLRSTNITLNLTSPTATILATYNYIWVKYVFSKTDTNAVGFPVQFTYQTFVCSALCENGICMQPDWRCDGLDQCGDGSDEKNCPGKVCPKVDTKGGTSAGIIILTIALSVIVTIIVFLLAPRIKRWFITRKYSAMDSDVTERI